MSHINFSDMFDEFEAQVSELLTGHMELDDNVLIENNSELKLRKGYCIEWGPVDNTERLLNKGSSRQTAIVTNTLANDGSFNDIEARKRATKDILCNCNTLVQWIEENPQLNDKAVLVKFINHPGPELIFDREKKAYLMIQATYQLEWF